jgi:hypothetical protein
MPAVALVSVDTAGLPCRWCSCALSRTDPAALAFAKRSLTFEAANCAIAIAYITYCTEPVRERFCNA